MAIQNSYTDPDSGEVSPLAHYVVDNPELNPRSRQVVLRVGVYASKEAYDGGKLPLKLYTRTFPMAQYTALRTLLLNQIEPALISTFWPTGVRVPD